MQVEVEKVEGGKARLRVTLTADEVNGAIESTYQRLGQRVRIPGFRPGKAPRAMLLRAYGEDSFYHQATDDAVRKWYPKALDESGVEPLDVGTLDLGDDHSHLAPGEDFSFAADVPTIPEIVLPEYGQIQIPAPSTSVSEPDVEKLIDDLRMATATLEPAPAKAADVGDVVKMNIHGRSEGKEVLADEDYQFEMLEESADSEGALPGLTKQLLDARPGDIREIVLSLPPDYRDEDLAGHSLSLNIVVKEILRKVPPEMNEEWVQRVSGNAKTMDELRQQIRDNLEHERVDEAINDVSTQIIDSLIGRTNPVVPEVLAEDEMGAMMREQRQYFERRGLQFDQFLIAAKKSEDEYRNELRPAAERRVKRDLVLDAVAKNENLQPSDRAIDAQVNAMSQAVSHSPAEFERLAGSARLHQTVTKEVRRRMALTKLVEMASGLKPWHAEESAGDAQPAEHSSESVIPNEVNEELIHEPSLETRPE